MNKDSKYELIYDFSYGSGVTYHELNIYYDGSVKTLFHSPKPFLEVKVDIINEQTVMVNYKDKTIGKIISEQNNNKERILIRLEDSALVNLDEDFQKVIEEIKNNNS